MKLEEEEKGRKVKKRRHRAAEMVVLTPKVTVLTGMPVGPPLSLSYVFCFQNAQLSFLVAPCECCDTGHADPLVQRKHQHTHTHVQTHTLE